MARLGELLVAAGLLTIEQVDRALRAQVMWGARLGTNLIELGFIDLDTLSTFLAQQHKQPAAFARHFEKADRELQRMMHPDLAEMYSCLPLMRAGARRDIVIASSSPLTKKIQARIADELAVEPEQIISSIAAELRIRYQLERVYNIQRPARFMRSPGKTIPPFPQFEIEPEPDNEDALEIAHSPEVDEIKSTQPFLATYTAPTGTTGNPPFIAALATKPVPTVDEDFSIEVDMNDSAPLAIVDAAPDRTTKTAVPPPPAKVAIGGLPFTTPSLPIPGVAPVEPKRSVPVAAPTEVPAPPAVAAKSAAVEPAPPQAIEPAATKPEEKVAPVVIKPRTADVMTGVAKPEPANPIIAPAKPIPSIVRPAGKLAVVEPAKPPVAEAPVAKAVPPVAKAVAPVVKAAPAESEAAIPVARPARLGSESGAIAAPNPDVADLADLDALSTDEDGLSIPHALEDDNSSGRERRRYVRTIADAPTDSERQAQSLGRIAIRRVAIAKDEIETEAEGNTLGEATRAIRRSTSRDRIADLCIDTLFRFAPSCAAATLLIVRGQVATTWKGFIRDSSPPPEIAVPLDQPGLIPKAVDRNATVRAPATELGPIDQLLMVSLAQKSGDMVIVPISIAKQVLCVIAIVTNADAPIATAESVAAGAGAAFARLMRDASR